MQAIETDIYPQCWGVRFGVGYDNNTNGKIEVDDNTGTEVGVRVTLGACGTAWVSGSTSVVFSTPFSYQWGRIRMIIDTAANSGQGRACLLYKLPYNAATWTPVSAIQQINLDLNTAATTARKVANWNRIFFGCGGADDSGIDNVTFESFTPPNDITLSSSSIDENSPVNSVVGTLSASPTSSYTYTLVAGTGDTDNGSFTISGSGLKINVSPNYATKNSYSLRVKATRDDGGSCATFEKIFTVTINDITAPTVTINQATGQTDPASYGNSINFTATFSEAISGFDNSDVTIGGTAGATTAIVTGTGPYNIEVTGMTQSGTVTVTIPANAATDAAGNQNSASINTDNSVTIPAGFTLSKITALVNESGTTDSSTVVLAVPPSAGQSIVFNVTSGNTSETTVSPASLTFTDANWSIPQMVTVTGVDDGSISDGNQTTTVTISVDDASSDNAFDALTDQTVNVTTADNDTPGVTVNPITLTVNEPNSSDIFTITLNTQPTGGNSVSIPLTITGTCTIDVISPVTIANADWSTSAMITVTASDDSIINAGGSSSCTIQTGSTISSAANYNGVNPDDVTVTINDDEIAGINGAAIGGTISATEGGATGDYTIVLSSQPSGDVEITVTADAQTQVSSDGTTFGNTAVLTFTSGNWNTAQTITVKAIDDTVIEGNHTGTITHAITGTVADTNYPTTLTLGNVTVNINDNDQQINNNTNNSGSGSTPLAATMNLTVLLRGNGQGSIKLADGKDAQPFATCRTEDQPCSYTRDTASWVFMEAIAAPGSEFKGWSGSSYCDQGNPFMIANLSCTANFALLATTPLSPLGLVAKAIAETQINLNWVDRNTTETGYLIERSNDHVTWSVITQTGINSTTYSDNGLTCGTTYYYHLHAVNSTGQSSPSVDANATTTACPLPPAPEPTAADPVVPDQTGTTPPTTEPVELHVFLSGEGSGQITLEQANIQCSQQSGCEYYFAPNTEIKLIATPAEGSTLWGWGGDEDCVDGVVTLENPKHCTAYFLLEEVEPSVTLPTDEIPVSLPTEELPTTPTEPLPVAIEPQPDRVPSDIPTTAKLPCPTDRHLNIHLDEDCDAEGRTIENFKVVYGGSLANAIITGKLVSEEGLVSHLTIEPTAILEGGYVTNVIINKGLMKDFTFVGKQIKGGKLAGKIIIASKVINEIRDVILIAGTVIQGKIGKEFAVAKLAGKIKGDKADPALLENVTIVDGTELENVVLGEGVILGQNVKQKNVVMVCSQQRANGKGFDQGGFPFDDSQTCFAVQENAIALTLNPDSNWLAQPAEQLFVVIQGQKAFMFSDQWQDWDGELATLQPAQSLTVSTVQTLEFPDISNFEGEFKFYVGLRLKNEETIVYHQVR